MAWSIETGLQLTDRVYVSSDSHYYLDMAYARGAKTILRPPETCTDEAGDYEVIRHAIEVLGLKDGLIVYLRPTTPFREEFHLGGVRLDDVADSVRSVEVMSESAWKCFELENQEAPVLPIKLLRPICGCMENANLPNQQMEQTYRGNGYVDIVRVKHVLETGELWGRCQAFITPRVIEIDTEEDFKYAEWWMDKNRR